jgi:hypothetical protein
MQDVQYFQPPQLAKMAALLPKLTNLHFFPAFMGFPFPMIQGARNRRQQEAPQPTHAPRTVQPDPNTPPETAAQGTSRPTEAPIDAPESALPVPETLLPTANIPANAQAQALPGPPASTPAVGQVEERDEEVEAEAALVAAAGRPMVPDNQPI